MAGSLLKSQFKLSPYSFNDAYHLSEKLGISMTLASILTRRGYSSCEDARTFLEGANQHDPAGLGGIEAASEVICSAIDNGEAITVHGDYDADGICSTTIAVRSLKKLGAKVNWFIPSRFEDGYGLSVKNVERLAAKGTGLLITVDCGVSSSDEVKRAQDLGMKVVVCDHHRWNGELPSCPVVHPRLGEYPFPDLCATAVTYKLMQYLYCRREECPDLLENELGLVALATVADMVPLVGENRDLVRQGLRMMSCTSLPGIAALMKVARLDSDRVGSRDIAFKLAPRLNAAGRLYRADAGVELLLTEDEKRAEEIARELEKANRERQDIEIGVLRQAESKRSQILKAGQDPMALVLAGEGWHEGVIGIVASRMVRNYTRPCVIIALPGVSNLGEKVGTCYGKGSGRSVPGFDLHQALGSCSEHLSRFGGHSMAAGLEIEPDKVESFRDSLVSYASERLRSEDLKPVQVADAVVPGNLLGLSLAEELQKLEPYGDNNSGVNLLVPSSRVSDVRSMGNGKHARFTLKSAGTNIEAVAFGCDGKIPVDGDAEHDFAFNLELNMWNGSVEPRLVLNGLVPAPGNNQDQGVASYEDIADIDQWWSLLREGFDSKPQPIIANNNNAMTRTTVDARGLGPIGYIGDLASTGSSVAILSADLSRRTEAVAAKLDTRRFGSHEIVLATKRSSKLSIEDLGKQKSFERLVAFVDYEVAEAHENILRSFSHIVMLDPPFYEAHLKAILELEIEPDQDAFTHLLWGGDEVRFTEKVAEQELGLKAPMRDIFRNLSNLDREGSLDESKPAEIIRCLEGNGSHPRAPRLAGRCLKVLSELELVEIEINAPIPELFLPKPKKTKTRLESSSTYVTYEKLYKESSRFLNVALTSKWE